MFWGWPLSHLTGHNPNMTSAVICSFTMTIHTHPSEPTWLLHAAACNRWGGVEFIEKFQFWDIMDVQLMKNKSIRNNF